MTSAYPASMSHFKSEGDQSVFFTIFGRTTNNPEIRFSYYLERKYFTEKALIGHFSIEPSKEKVFQLNATGVFSSRDVLETQAKAIVTQK